MPRITSPGKVSNVLEDTSNSRKLLLSTSECSFHVCKFLVHLLTNIVGLSFHGGLLVKGRMIERMSGSKFKHGYTVSLNGIFTNKSDTFSNCFQHILVINRGRITIYKFEEYKWKFQHSCSTTISAVVGGGIQRKLPRKNTFATHPSELRRVRVSSFNHQDVI